jgi:hypothetical protein
MHVQPTQQKAVAIVVADPVLLDMARERLTQHDMTILATDNYGEIAAHLAPDAPHREWPTLGLVLVDARVSLGQTTMIHRCHTLCSLLREHVESGEAWPAVVVIIDSQQTDPAWLAAHPIVRGLIENRADVTVTILNPWDDGTWATQLHHALDAALTLRESMVLTPA